MKKVFLLEDSRIVSELLKFELENELQCEVVCFKTGNDLIANLLTWPDAIILDYFIDNEFKENGLNILNKIKAINKTIPVIIFSGQHNLKLAIELIRAGAVDYIDKNEDTFLEDVNNAVRNVFQYEDAKTGLNKMEKKITVDRKQILALGFFGAFLLLALVFISYTV